MYVSCVNCRTIIRDSYLEMIALSKGFNKGAKMFLTLNSLIPMNLLVLQLKSIMSALCKQGINAEHIHTYICLGNIKD